MNPYYQDSQEDRGMKRYYIISALVLLAIIGGFGVAIVNHQYYESRYVIYGLEDATNQQLDSLLRGDEENRICLYDIQPMVGDCGDWTVLLHWQHANGLRIFNRTCMRFLESLDLDFELMHTRRVQMWCASPVSKEGSN